jgi:hypothetical protein
MPVRRRKEFEEQKNVRFPVDRVFDKVYIENSVMEIITKRAGERDKTRQLVGDLAGARRPDRGLPLTFYLSRTCRAITHHASRFTPLSPRNCTIPAPFLHRFSKMHFITPCPPATCKIRSEKRCNSLLTLLHKVASASRRGMPSLRRRRSFLRSRQSAKTSLGGSHPASPASPVGWRLANRPPTCANLCQPKDGINPHIFFTRQPIFAAKVASASRRV